MPKPLFARKAWISACKFHDASDADVLRKVVKRVKEGLDREPPPVVLLDLDSTLYDTAPRTHVIVCEWLAAHRDTIPERVRTALHPLEEGHVSYSLLDLFAALGLSAEEPEVEAAWRHLREFWRPRFFSNEYLRYDRPYAGAARFVTALHELGAIVVYLTGRDKPGMEAGTLANLARDAFPSRIERATLIMKPQREGDDYEHKVGLKETLARLGTIVASFENEPRNLMGLQAAFPEALHVFVETVCSDHPAPGGVGLYRLKGFPLIKG